MLANLLPGLRHLRTPLATGYLYLLAIWLLLGAQRLLPSDQSDGPAGRVADLVSLLGPGPSLAAISFAAYLFGSIVVIKTWPLGMSPVQPSESRRRRLEYDDLEDHFDRLSRRLGSRVEARDWARPLLGWVGEVVNQTTGRISYGDLRNDSELTREIVTSVEGYWYHERERRLRRLSYYQRWLTSEDSSYEDEEWLRQERAEQIEADGVPADAYVDQDGHLLPAKSSWWSFDEHLGEPVPSEDLRDALDEHIEDEVDLITARLRVESEYVFDDYDRLRSEAELRYSIVPALVLIVIIVAATWNWLALIALALPAVLLRQAYLTERSSVAMVLSAVQYGVVESPTVAALKSIAARADERRRLALSSTTANQGLAE